MKYGKSTKFKTLGVEIQTWDEEPNDDIYLNDGVEILETKEIEVRSYDNIPISRIIINHEDKGQMELRVSHRNIRRLANALLKTLEKKEVA